MDGIGRACDIFYVSYSRAGGGGGACDSGASAVVFLVLVCSVLFCFILSCIRKSKLEERRSQISVSCLLR